MSAYNTRSNKTASVLQTAGSAKPVSVSRSAVRPIGNPQEALKPTEDRSYRDVAAPRALQVAEQVPEEQSKGLRSPSEDNSVGKEKSLVISEKVDSVVIDKNDWGVRPQAAWAEPLLILISVL